MEDKQDPPAAQPADPPQGAGGEKEEEEAFLISLYKFMKDRHTPIERIPHLGFKQINLWKIYKAVEKLGAYELVTGRRLWKNVYDELGGSPGSTSAATCTRRHYERLVLPYVRHLKGEDDKPLPPSKPRKQYKVSKGAEGGKRGKKEKGREQVPPDKAKPEVAAGPEVTRDTPEVTRDTPEVTRDTPERGRGAEGCPSPTVATPSPSGGCPSPPFRTHPQSYKRLFSGFSSQGTHPIMSPLAKKKLLAQVSKAQALPCHKRHCPEGQRSASDASPRSSPEPPWLATGHHQDEERSPGGARATGSSVGPGAIGGDSQPCPQAEEGGPVATVFTGYFHAYGQEVLKPVGCHPFWGYFSSLKDFLEPPSTFPGGGEELEKPQELRSKGGQAWSVERQPGDACATVWVAPRATFSPAEARGKRGREDEERAFSPSAKLRAISPFLKEADGGASLPRGQQGLAKPKAVVASPGYSTLLPQAPDVYKGAPLHFPTSFGNPLEHLKTQGVPVAPSLTTNPFIIPAFPSPLVATSTQPSDLNRPLATGPGHYPASYESLIRHRLYRGATWAPQPHYSPPHCHTKL